MSESKFNAGDVVILQDEKDVIIIEVLDYEKNTAKALFSTYHKSDAFNVGNVSDNWDWKQFEKIGKKKLIKVFAKLLEGKSK